MFKPTFLYIKQHTITGMLYFGKTTKNPEKYKGSGKHWKNHLNKHGNKHTITLWYCLFLEKESIQDFAINFSRQENIVKSPIWANKIEENGLDGASVGHPGAKMSDETLKILSEKTKQNWAINKDYIKAQQKIAANLPERLEQYKNIQMLYWQNASEERRIQQRNIALNLNNTAFLKMAKSKRSEQHKHNISNALKSKTKSAQHLSNVKKAKDLNYMKRLKISSTKFIDHLGNIFDNVLIFLRHYNLRISFIENLDSPIKSIATCKKLNIQKQTLSKRELGFKFPEEDIDY